MKKVNRVDSSLLMEHKEFAYLSLTEGIIVYTKYEVVRNVPYA